MLLLALELIPSLGANSYDERSHVARHSCGYFTINILCRMVAASIKCEFLQQPCGSLANLHGSCQCAR